MATTFGDYIPTIVEQAGHHASQHGSATVEAQHLLLAVAGQEGTTAHQVLTSVGLDQQAIREALDREFEHSLRAAGVSRAAFDLPRPSGDPRPSRASGPRPGWRWNEASRPPPASGTCGRRTCCWGSWRPGSARCRGRWPWPASTRPTCPCASARHAPIRSDERDHPAWSEP